MPFLCKRPKNVTLYLLFMQQNPAFHLHGLTDENIEYIAGIQKDYQWFEEEYRIIQE